MSTAAAAALLPLPTWITACASSSTFSEVDSAEAVSPLCSFSNWFSCSRTPGTVASTPARLCRACTFASAVVAPRCTTSSMASSTLFTLTWVLSKRS